MRVYGLIGYPLGHSFSGKYFAEKFQKEGISDCEYRLFPIPTIADLPAVLTDTEGLAGLNVTIPYKEQVIPYLYDMDTVVRETGACNCIRIIDGKLHGFNTDVEGFRYSLIQKLEPHHDQALVLGTGGAAKAVMYVLDQLNIRYMVVSRKQTASSISYAQLTKDIIHSHSLIINTTPLGTYPDVEEAPPIPYEGIGQDHYLFDLVYNPPETTFLKKGKERNARTNNGSDMLAIQAEASWRIWTGRN